MLDANILKLQFQGNVVDISVSKPFCARLGVFMNVLLSMWSTGRPQTHLVSPRNLGTRDETRDTTMDTQHRHWCIRFTVRSMTVSCVGGNRGYRRLSSLALHFVTRSASLAPGMTQP